MKRIWENITGLAAWLVFPLILFVVIFGVLPGIWHFLEVWPAWAFWSVAVVVAVNLSNGWERFVAMWRTAGREASR